MINSICLLILQGLVGAIFEGIGVSCGSFVCGYLMNEFGGSITFRIFGVGAICLSFIHYFVQRFMDQFSNKHGKTLNITQNNSTVQSNDNSTTQSNQIESFKQHFDI